MSASSSPMSTSFLKGSSKNNTYSSQGSALSSCVFNVGSTQYECLKLMLVETTQNKLVWRCLQVQPTVGMMILRITPADRKKTAPSLGCTSPYLLKCLHSMQVKNKRGSYSTTPSEGGNSSADDSVSPPKPNRKRSLIKQSVRPSTTIHKYDFFDFFTAVTLRKVIEQQAEALPVTLRLRKDMPKQRVPLSQSIIRRILYQVGHALAALHREGRVHGNILPDSILLSPDLMVRVVEWESRTPTQIRWSSPETAQLDNSNVELGFQKRCSGDVWAFGCLAVYLATCTEPFQDEDESLSILTFLQLSVSLRDRDPLVSVQLNPRNRCGTYGPFEGIEDTLLNTHPKLQEVVRKCLQADYRCRPGIEEILALEFFSETKPEGWLNCTAWDNLKSLLSSDQKGMETKPGTLRTMEEREYLLSAKVASQFQKDEYGEECVSILVKNIFVAESIMKYRVAFRSQSSSSLTQEAGSTTEPPSGGEGVDSKFSDVLEFPLASKYLHEQLGTNEECIRIFIERCFGADSDKSLHEALVRTCSEIADTVELSRSVTSSCNDSFQFADAIDTREKGLLQGSFFKAFGGKDGKRLNLNSSWRKHGNTIIVTESAPVSALAKALQPGVERNDTSDEEGNVVGGNIIATGRNPFECDNGERQSSAVVFSSNEVVPDENQPSRGTNSRIKCLMVVASVTVFLVVVVIVVLLSVLLTR